MTGMSGRLEAIRSELLKVLSMIHYCPENFYFRLQTLKPGSISNPNEVAYVFDELCGEGLITVTKVEFVGRSFLTHFMLTSEGRVVAAREASCRQ